MTFLIKLLVVMSITGKIIGASRKAEQDDLITKRLKEEPFCEFNVKAWRRAVQEASLNGYFFEPIPEDDVTQQHNRKITDTKTLKLYQELNKFYQTHS